MIKNNKNKKLEILILDSKSKLYIFLLYDFDFLPPRLLSKTNPLYLNSLLSSSVIHFFDQFKFLFFYLNSNNQSLWVSLPWLEISVLCLTFNQLYGYLSVCKIPCIRLHSQVNRHRFDLSQVVIQRHSPHAHSPTLVLKSYSSLLCLKGGDFIASVHTCNSQFKQISFWLCHHL